MFVYITAGCQEKSIIKHYIRCCICRCKAKLTFQRCKMLLCSRTIMPCILMVLRLVYFQYYINILLVESRWCHTYFMQTILIELKINNLSLAKWKLCYCYFNINIYHGYRRMVHTIYI